MRENLKKLLHRLLLALKTSMLKLKAIFLNIRFAMPINKITTYSIYYGYGYGYGYDYDYDYIDHYNNLNNNRRISCRECKMLQL